MGRFDRGRSQSRAKRDGASVMRMGGWNAMRRYGVMVGVVAALGGGGPGREPGRNRLGTRLGTRSRTRPKVRLWIQLRARLRIRKSKRPRRGVGRSRKHKRATMA